MIDFDRIGRRIKEQRKYIKMVSQEQMAEDLYMYQADISNIEKAKSGSGITDLVKLDQIAEYFCIPLETLLFGREDKNMITYHGEKMKLGPSKKKMTQSHKKTLARLFGIDPEIEFTPAITYECGPYMLYTMIEEQRMFGEDSYFGEDGIIQNPEFFLSKFHTYIFLGTEIIGVMTADLTSVMQHVNQELLSKLNEIIPPDIIDVTDVIRTLNPYWALWQLSEGEERESYFKPLLMRMDELRESGEDRPILYIESVYVREDSRQHGMFRMYIDFLKAVFEGCIMWLNMEPTGGTELDSEYSCLPTYSVSELGQLNINAAIAEKVGFTIDPETWHIEAETTDANGNSTIETVLVRKCAYFFPEEIRKIICNDNDLVAQGRAKQKIVQAKEGKKKIAGVNYGTAEDSLIAEVKISVPGNQLCYATAFQSPDSKRRYVVSHNSILKDNKGPLIEEYDSLEAAAESEYLNFLEIANDELDNYESFGFFDEE